MLRDRPFRRQTQVPLAQADIRGVPHPTHTAPSEPAVHAASLTTRAKIMTFSSTKSSILRLARQLCYAGAPSAYATVQETVFERLAVKSIESVLDGMNSTIFAYGQTGSGKTFTITGGAERYQDRGLIPRSISHFYQAAPSAMLLRRLLRAAFPRPQPAASC